MTFTLLRAADRLAVPWKNGGGITRELAVWPPGASFDDFVWRVSMAEVHQDGPFSSFPGVDRILT
ncbi:MAG: HutD family protein, partial [Phenylobacterium sp.]